MLWLAPISVLGLAVWALAPGLSGGFLFDDYVNLPALGEFGRIDDAQRLLLYLTSAIGDPIGRPLSLLSFLIDANDWPAQAFAFLRTNIILHLLNGGLLYLVLLQLGRHRSWTPVPAQTSAILGSGIWLLHPLWLSTTLYIIQRETILAASFVLVGFLAWMAGRRRVIQGQWRSGTVLLALGSIVCTVLAALCKANGLLLPLLLLVAEASVLEGLPAASNSGFLRLRRILLWAPLLSMLVAIVWMVPHFAEQAALQRPWTLGQRLISEPRVLCNYLELLLFPRPISGGVFHDNFAPSADLFHPLSTLPAILLVVGFAVAAWRYRRRQPVMAFAVLFFLAGHTLEGSVAPLELYFEHRNYLPAMPLFWPLGAWLAGPGRLQKFRAFAACALLLGLSIDTRLGAHVWGDPPSLAFAWAASNPESPRAGAFAAQYDMAAGQFARAKQRLQQAMLANPKEAQLAFNLVDAECGLGGVEPETIVILEHALTASANAALLDYSWLSSAVPRAQSASCSGLDLQTIENLLAAARSNPHFLDAPGREQDFDHIHGLVSLARGDATGALIDFDHALAAWPRPEVALQQAALLGAAGAPDLGLRHLDAYAAYPVVPKRLSFSMAGLHAWLLDRDSYWQHEMTHLRAALAEAVKQRQNAGTSGGGPAA